MSDSLMSLVTFAQDPRSREILRTTLQLGNVRCILTIFRTLRLLHDINLDSSLNYELDMNLDDLDSSLNYEI